jgi:Fe2+ or Zn2+ uptake regulation protein
MGAPPQRHSATEVHRRAASQLAATGLRYTRACRTIVDALAAAEAPLTISTLIGANPTLPSSSAYRNVRNLQGAGIVVEVPHVGTARYELSEQAGAGRHHHALCRSCGDVAIAPASASVDDAIAVAVDSLRRSRLLFDWQQVAFVGICATCRNG